MKEFFVEIVKNLKKVTLAMLKQLILKYKEGL